MLRAFIRYLFFTIPEMVLRGIEFILFDKDEINSIYFAVQAQQNKNMEEQKTIVNYLERCRKL